MTSTARAGCSYFGVRILRHVRRDLADLAARGALGGLDGPRRLRQRSARFDQEQLAGFGQFDLPPVAIEQRDAKFPLDRLDLQT